jgi:hypothetical protein
MRVGSAYVPLLCAISTLSTGMNAQIPLLRIGKSGHLPMVIGADGPVSGSGVTRQGGGARRSDLRRQAMTRSFGFKSGPAGKRRRKRQRPLARCGTKIFLRGDGGHSRTQRAIVPRRAADGQRTVPRDWSAVSEASPELVSQDRKRDATGFGPADPRLRTPVQPSLGAGRGWQQCRPLYLWRHPARTLTPRAASRHRPTRLEAGSDIRIGEKFSAPAVRRTRTGNPRVGPDK